MYSQRVSWFPEFGRGPELEPLLEDRVRTLQNQHVRARLARTVYGVDGPAFHATTLFDSLADLQHYREEMAPDPQDIAKIAALCRQSPRFELLEMLIPSPQGATPPRYAQLIHNMPANGEAMELERVLADRVQAIQQAGHRAALVVQVAGPAAGKLTVTLPVAGLAELEERRTATRSDPSFPEFLARIGALSAGPAAFEILQVLVPQQAST